MPASGQLSPTLACHKGISHCLKLLPLCLSPVNVEFSKVRKQKMTPTRRQAKQQQTLGLVLFAVVFL